MGGTVEARTGAGVFKILFTTPSEKKRIIHDRQNRSDAHRQSRLSIEGGHSSTFKKWQPEEGGEDEDTGPPPHTRLKTEKI